MKHLAIFLLLLVPVLASCSGDKDGQGGRQAAPVHVMTVQPQDVPRVLGAVGNVKASASVGLTPRWPSPRPSCTRPPTMRAVTASWWATAM